MASTHQTLFLTNYSMREKAQAVTASLRDFPLTWRDMPIHMHWRWKWLESYNNCTFSTGKGKCLFNLLSWIPNSFCTFHDYVRQTIPPLHSHWRHVTDFSSFALKNRVCACPEKQSLPWKFSLYWIYFSHSGFLSNLCLPRKTECIWTCIEYIFFIIQNLEQLALALKNSVPWIHCIEYKLLSYRILNNLRLPWITEFALNSLYWIFYHSEC